jgi:hypothetical protein
MRGHRTAAQGHGSDPMDVPSTSRVPDAAHSSYPSSDPRAIAPDRVRSRAEGQAASLSMKGAEVPRET